MVYYSDEPSADAGALPVWFLSRLSREHVTVALSGEGADELFGGYETYLADRLARPLRLLPAVVRRRLLSACERHLPVSDEKIGLEYKLKRWLEGSLLPADSAHFFWNGAFSPTQLRAICPGSPDPDLEMLVERLGIDPGTGLLNRYLWVDQSYYLPDDILSKVDRMSMAHSLEVRPPFLDPRIMQFAASLPEHLKIRGFRQKFVLKELMRDKLPASILRRRKTGLDIPTHDWFRGPLHPLLMDTLAPEALDSTGIFCAGAIHSLISDHMERRVNIGYQLWGLVTLFLWLKRWKVEIPTPQKASLAADALSRRALSASGTSVV
jgi:asparagine synthase (glutamine-hydrolysing)